MQPNRASCCAPFLIGPRTRTPKPPISNLQAPSPKPQAPKPQTPKPPKSHSFSKPQTECQFRPIRCHSIRLDSIQPDSIRHTSHMLNSRRCYRPRHVPVPRVPLSLCPSVSLSLCPSVPLYLCTIPLYLVRVSEIQAGAGAQARQRNHIDPIFFPFPFVFFCFFPF